MNILIENVPIRGNSGDTYQFKIVDLKYPNFENSMAVYILFSRLSIDEKYIRIFDVVDLSTVKDIRIYMETYTPNNTNANLIAYMIINNNINNKIKQELLYIEKLITSKGNCYFRIHQ